MSSMTFFATLIFIIAALFLFINFVFAPHHSYEEKDSMFECGYHSFLQSRSPFTIAFFIYALVYLLLDLEILLSYPFAVSGYINNLYGLLIIISFIVIISIGFVFELGKGALKILSKQTFIIQNKFWVRVSVLNNKPENGNFSFTPLHSSILPFNIPSVKKYFSLKNVIVGLICVIIMAIVKTLHIPTYILNFFNVEDIEILEYIILGVLGLILRLGIKGVVDEIPTELYATTGGGDGEEPWKNKDYPGSNPHGSSGGSGDSLPDKGKQKEVIDPLNKKPQSTSSLIDAQINEPVSKPKAEAPDVDKLVKNLGSLHLSTSLDGVAKRFANDLAKVQEELRQTPETDPKYKDLEMKLEQGIEDIAFLTRASAEEIRRYMNAQVENSNSSGSSSGSSKRSTENDDNTGGDKKKRSKGE